MDAPCPHGSARRRSQAERQIGVLFGAAPLRRRPVRNSTFGSPSFACRPTGLRLARSFHQHVELDGPFPRSNIIMQIVSTNRRPVFLVSNGHSARRFLRWGFGDHPSLRQGGNGLRVPNSRQSNDLRHCKRGSRLCVWAPGQVSYTAISEPCWPLEWLRFLTMDLPALDLKTAQTAAMTLLGKCCYYFLNCTEPDLIQGLRSRIIISNRFHS